MARKVKAAQDGGGGEWSRRGVQGAGGLGGVARATRRLASWRVSSACMPRRSRPGSSGSWKGPGLVRGSASQAAGRGEQPGGAVRADRPPEDGGRVVEKKICPARLTRVGAGSSRGTCRAEHARQCELLGLARGSWYYEPAGETAENLELMRRIDEQYLKPPFYGSRRLADEFERESQARAAADAGDGAGGDLPQAADDGAACRSTRFTRICCGMWRSTRPNQVWSSDITYIPLRDGFLYLTAVMDWYSRYVLAWRLSNTLGRERFASRPWRRRLRERTAGDLQHGSRSAVHERGVHALLGVAWRGDQHGWPRPGVGQRVRRAVVADGEVRGGVPEGLRRRLAGRDEPGRILRVLLPRAPAPGVGPTDAGGGVWAGA